MDDGINETAYFRFGIISSLLSPEPGRTLAERIDEQSQKTWQHPGGKLCHYAGSTIEDWLYRYRRGGLSALVDPARRDRGTFPGMPDTVREAAMRLLEEHPEIRTSTMYAHLQSEGLLVDGRPSRSTFYRWMAANRLQQPPKPARVRLAFEAGWSGALWQADIMYGPKIPKLQPNGRRRKTQTYLVAVLDDHSRLLCEGRFFHSQGMEAWLETLPAACCRRGVPEKLYCDNAKVFTSPQIHRIGAVLGTQVLHAPVRDGAAKGKIERFFRTVRSSFLEALELEGAPPSLEALNRAFHSWVETRYNGAIHSALGITPQQRWLAGAHRLRTISVEEASELFLFETERSVKKDGTFTIQGQRFEIGSALAGKRVTVRYEAVNLTRVDVWYENELKGRAAALDLRANDGRTREAGK